ncbi:MAG TPA: Ig-like domain-containing protein [Longimicrobium sp.]|nr:Ig-like domain-containing protein [Longimicrobium sp.]
MRVLDGFGNPVAGTVVQWSTQAGIGQADPASSTTDSTGTARTAWTLGTRLAHMDTLKADAGTLHARFGALTTLGAFNLQPLSSTEINTLVGRPAIMTVRATLPDGRPIEGLIVNWTRVEDYWWAGELVAFSEATDDSGEASAGLYSEEPLRDTVVVAGGGQTIRFSVRIDAEPVGTLRTSVPLTQTSRQFEDYGVIMELEACVRDSYGNSLGPSQITWTSTANLVDVTPGHFPGSPSPPPCSMMEMWSSTPGVFTATATYQNQSLTFTLTVLPPEEVP